MILIGRGLDLRKEQVRPKGKLETGLSKMMKSGCAVFRVREMNKRRLCGELPRRKARLEMDEPEAKRAMDCTGP